MTQLELFQATVRHQNHGQFLYYASFTPDLQRRVAEKYGVLPEHDALLKQLGMYQPAGVEPTPKKNDQPDFSRYFADVEKPEGTIINSLGVLEIPAKFFHFTGYVSPLRHAKTLADLEAFPYPCADFDDTGMREKVLEAHGAGRVARTFIGHMYESAWQIRGYEEFLMDMAERPAWVEYILDRITERNIRIATAAGRAGADFILTGDDVANQNSLMFSKPMWREFMKKRWAKVYAAARAHNPKIQIWYHSDGNIWSIIPDLIEIGVTILNPIQPECVDPLKVKQEFGKDIVLDGAIGTQTVMPFGTPEDVKRTVRKMKKSLGYDGAYIISPTHTLEPEVPLENIGAFLETAREI